MPTPPKETIGGKKGHHVIDHEFAQRQFEYIEKLEEFKNSKDFADCPEVEQQYISKEIEQQNYAYETLRQRVENY